MDKLKMLYLIIFIFGFAGTYFIIPIIASMLKSSDVVRENYKKKLIPVSMGICFLPMLIINSIILIYFSNTSIQTNVYMYIFGLMAMFFAGLMDDIIGNRDVTGLKGHFKSMLKGKLTTGGFKALFGGFVGILISVSVAKDVKSVIIGTLVIALSTNFMNLLDLRPGRAIKVYIPITIVLICFASTFNKAIPLLLLPNVLAYFYSDLKAKAMMGDAGSNVLGISIGIFFVINYSTNIQLIWLVFLIFIHVLTEKFSLTSIIEKNKILNYLDKLGR